MQISKNVAFVKFSCLYKSFQESLFFEGFESVEVDSEKLQKVRLLEILKEKKKHVYLVSEMLFSFQIKNEVAQKQNWKISIKFSY